MLHALDRHALDGGSGGSRAGGLADQVVAFGDVRGEAGGLGVGRGGGGQVAAELVQVAADGVPAVPLAEHVAQPVGFAQPGGGAAHVADRDRTSEHRGGSRRTGSSVRATRSSYQARICGQSRREARVVEEHQREQAARLRFLGGEGELAGQPDRYAGQVDTGGRASMPGRV